MSFSQIHPCRITGAFFQTAASISSHAPWNFRLFPVFHVLTILPSKGTIVNILKTSLPPQWQWGILTAPCPGHFFGGVHYLNLHLNTSEVEPGLIFCISAICLFSYFVHFYTSLVVFCLFIGVLTSFPLYYITNIFFLSVLNFKNIFFFRNVCPTPINKYILLYLLIILLLVLHLGS